MNAAGTHSHKRSDRMLAMLALLQENGQMSLSSLATELGTSEATIRRDVAVLASQGLLDRTHGGARPIQGSRELPVRLRDGRNQAAKSRIAAAAAKLVPEGKHAIGLSGGTTAAEVLRALHHRTDLTIITNSLSIGLEAAEQGQGRVLIAGGVLRSNSLELVGSLAEATLRLVNVGTALVGVDGLSSSGGARTNHTMIERAQRVIAVADASKIGHVTLAKMADLSEIDILVTDSNAPEEELAHIRELGVEVVVVPVPAEPKATTGS